MRGRKKASNSGCSFSCGRRGISLVMIGRLDMALNIDDVLGHHRARARGIAALQRLQYLAVVTHYAATHLGAALGPKDGIANRLIDGVHYDVEDRIIGGFGHAAMKFHVALL